MTENTKYKKQFEYIKNEIENNNIVLFMKGTSRMPMCGFSGIVIKILKELGVAYKDIDILKDAELREAIKIFSDWPTIPQLYIKGEFIGGCDIVKTIYADGSLEKLLQEKKL